MKTIEFFKTEIPNLVSQMERLQIGINKSKTDKETSLLRKQKKTMKKRLEFLTFCRNYIETNPSPDFVKKESERLTNRINMFMKNYEPPKNAETMFLKDVKAHKKAFEKEMGIPKIKTQLTTLNFLLN